MEQRTHDRPHIEGIKLLAEIAAGGSSVVYQAIEELLDRQVAVKVTNQVLNASEQKRFRREAKTLASLRHPNIVDIFQYGITADGRSFLVMEFVTGPSLSQRLESGPLSPVEFLAIFSGIISGLKLVHSKRIVHRDIKPANIALCQNATLTYAKLLDFGIAKTDQDQQLTTEGVVLGSPLYMSPEQISGSQVDERSDLYSLGCVMFESLLGSPPFEGSNPLEVMYKHNNAPRPSVEKFLDAGYSKELAAVVLKCMAVSAGDRYANVTQLNDALLESTKKTSAGKQAFSMRMSIACTLAALCITFAVLRSSPRPELQKPSAPPMRTEVITDKLTAFQKAYLTGDYPTAIELGEKLLPGIYSTDAVRYNAVCLQLSNAYSCQADRIKDGKERTRLKRLAKQWIGTSLKSLENTIYALDNGATSLQDTLTSYLLRVAADSGKQAASNEYLTKRNQKAYANNPIRMRHLEKGYAEFLARSKDYESAEKLYNAVILKDRSMYGELGVTTLTDQISLYSVLANERKKPQAAALAMKLTRTIQAEEVPFSRSNRYYISLGLVNALIETGEVTLAQDLIQNQQLPKWEYDRHEIATLYTYSASAYKKISNDVEELRALRKAISLTDKPQHKECWQKYLSLEAQRIERSQVEAASQTVHSK